MLEVSEQYRVEENIRDRMQYDCFSTANHHCQGSWGEIRDLNEELLNSSLRIGDFWHVSNYLYFSGLVKGEQGDLEHLMNVIDRMHEIGKAYDSPLFLTQAGMLKTDYLLKSRNAQRALEVAEEGFTYYHENGYELQEIMFSGFKAEAHKMAGDAKSARDSISQTKEIYDKQPNVVLCLYVAPYLAECFAIYLNQLEHAICSENSSEVTNLRKRAYEAGKAAVKNSKKYAPYRTKIFRLMGFYYWLIGKQGKALRWWDKTIQEGERLGARPDLSRTYFEVGKRLFEPQSKYKELNGIEAKAYLEKAGILFEEMSLERDLDDLDRLKANCGL